MKKFIFKSLLVSSVLALGTWNLALAVPHPAPHPHPGPHPAPHPGPHPGHPGPGFGHPHPSPNWGWGHAHSHRTYAGAPIISTSCVPDILENKDLYLGELNLLAQDIHLGLVSDLNSMSEGDLKDLFLEIQADEEKMDEVNSLLGKSEIENLYLYVLSQIN